MLPGEMEGEPAAVIEEISPRDTMFRDRQRYLKSGRRGLECIRAGMEAADIAGAESVLDLPSGYGRVLRWIHAAFPHARLGACDIVHEGVDFCAATFGATPIYGRADPAEVEIDSPYDVAWSGSLLTHVPPQQWEAFLELFERALRPGGLLVFTTHGRRIAEVMRDPERSRTYGAVDLEGLLRDHERDGIAYAEYQFGAERREELSLPSAYGLTLTDPDAVREILARRPRLRLVGFEESRFNGQDAWSVVREGG